VSASTKKKAEAIVIGGAGYLAARYGLSTLLNLGNMLVLTWWIGPRAYGLFASAVALSTFLASLSRAGLDTYVVRCEKVPGPELLACAAAWIARISAGLVLAGVLAAPLLRAWYPSPGVVAPYLALLITVPLVGLAGIPLATLERDLQFQKVAGIELGGQMLALLVSATLAWLQMGVWAPVCGHIAWQAFLFGGGAVAAGWTPRLSWRTPAPRDMLSFALGYSTSMRVWQARSLVAPLLVGRLTGPEGVAYVALALRFAEGLGFVRAAAGRVGIAALSRWRDDPRRFVLAVEKGMRWQVLTLGPLLCTFALLGPYLVPRFLGARWVPSLTVFPLVAAGVLIHSIFNLQASALFVLERQWSVTWSYGWHVALLTGVAAVAVPRLGLRGYGWAELAACLAYGGIHRSLKQVAGLVYGSSLGWATAFVVVLLGQIFAGAGRTLSWFPLLIMIADLLWKFWRNADGTVLSSWARSFRTAPERSGP
jgi:O-antigen/teichoic acid export membrane protein